MAVEASKVKARLRALFPKANLQDLDKVCNAIGQKLEDEATDEVIDSAISDYNDVFSFESLASKDDTLRTLKAKLEKKPEEVEKKVKEDVDDRDALIKELYEEVKSIKAERLSQTREQKFRSEERLKNVPKVLFDGYIPNTDEEYEVKVEALLNVHNTLKLDNYGGDTPASGESQKPLEIKQYSPEQANDIVRSMGINV